MRIGIDAREIVGRPTGVGRFLTGLLREWALGRDLPHDMVLYAPAPLDLPLDGRRFRVRTVAARSSGTWWEQVALPRQIRADALDVFFAPAYTAPIGTRVPTVAAIYDLSYVAHPEWFRLRDGVRRRWLTRQTAARARRIITLSEFARREIVERLDVAEAAVRTIVPGIDPIAVARGAYAEPRILYVGSLFNRRHVPDLVHAVGDLTRTRPDVSLDIVGDDRTYPPERLDRVIERSGLGSRVRWHRYVSDQHLRELYGRARVFAFVSEYEGLGLTPLEALAAGVPPVVADTPVAREACGAAALYVPVGDRRALVSALERLLTDEATRAAVLAAAPATLARYDWPRAARETLAVLCEAAAPAAAGR